MKKTIVAMSGGVDSSVAALLVKNAGFDILGITLKMHSANKDESDADDARGIAERLEIPFKILDFTACFEREVIARFAASYERGETPNPCIECNRYVKLGELLKQAEELGYDFIATGHYARVEESGGRFLLKKGIDPSKDQSYMLYALKQEQLSRLILPLGALTKEQVREIAAENGFENADRADSQDICFIPDGDYAGFIEQYVGKSFPKGEFVGTNGEIYGEHKGIIHYTVGQRKGLGLSFPQPMYVCRLDTEKNRVVLGRHEELFSSELTAKSINLISVSEIKEPMRVKAKIRYRHEPQNATVIQTGADELKVSFDEPQRAVTKGQAVVLYDGDTVVGGGVIV